MADPSVLVAHQDLPDSRMSVTPDQANVLAKSGWKRVKSQPRRAAANTPANTAGSTRAQRASTNPSKKD